MDTLKFTKIRKVKSPQRAHPTDAGIDFFVPDDCQEIIISPGDSWMISGGLKIKIPNGHALIFFNKSGIAANKSLVLGSCVIDQDYEGELIYNIHNIGTNSQIIHPGDKIVQGILLPVNYAEIEEISSEEELYANSISLRKDGGFGSTGDK